MQLESRLREAVRDGNALAREVGELKAALKRAQAAHGSHGLPAKRQGLPNGRTATDKVSLIEELQLHMPSLVATPTAIRAHTKHLLMLKGCVLERAVSQSHTENCWTSNKRLLVHGTLNL